MRFFPARRERWMHWYHCTQQHEGNHGGQAAEHRMLAPMSGHSSSPSGVLSVSAINQIAPVADSIATTA
jgi:hypothetical protein